MLSLHGKHGVVISRIPVMQNGLGDVVTRHFPDFELTYCRSAGDDAREAQLRMIRDGEAMPVENHLQLNDEHEENLPDSGEEE